MTGCPDWQDRLQGLIDGELDAAHAAEVEAHVAGCAACARARDEALRVRGALRGQGMRAEAPARLMTRLDRLAAPARRPRHYGWALWGSGGAAAALAACAVLALAVGPEMQTASLERDLIAGHVRSQLASHLTDVVTSDQHVVKPWFGGKLDFSPPVIDLADQGFPMEGGRLDYIGGRTVAAIVYRRGRHVINLFVWPGKPGGGPAQTRSGEGYTLLHWTAGGMSFWAVSDVNESDLREFERLLRAKA